MARTKLYFDGIIESADDDEDDLRNIELDLDKNGNKRKDISGNPDKKMKKSKIDQYNDENLPNPDSCNNDNVACSSSASFQKVAEDDEDKEVLRLPEHPKPKEASVQTNADNVQVSIAEAVKIDQKILSSSSLHSGLFDKIPTSNHECSTSSDAPQNQTTKTALQMFEQLQRYYSSNYDDNNNGKKLWAEAIAQLHKEQSDNNLFITLIKVMPNYLPSDPDLSLLPSDLKDTVVLIRDAFSNNKKALDDANKNEITYEFYRKLEACKAELIRQEVRNWLLTRCIEDGHARRIAGRSRRILADSVTYIQKMVEPVNTDNDNIYHYITKGPRKFINGGHYTTHICNRCGFSSKAIERIKSHVQDKHAAHLKHECVDCGALVACLAPHLARGHADPSGLKILFQQDDEVMMRQGEKADIKAFYGDISQHYTVPWRSNVTGEIIGFSVCYTHIACIKTAALKLLDGAIAALAAKKVRFCGHMRMQLSEEDCRFCWQEAFALGICTVGLTLTNNSKWFGRIAVGAICVMKTNECKEVLNDHKKPLYDTIRQTFKSKGHKNVVEYLNTHEEAFLKVSGPIRVYD